jgi:hypothetical protein
MFLSKNIAPIIPRTLEKNNIKYSGATNTFAATEYHVGEGIIKTRITTAI